MSNLFARIWGRSCGGLEFQGWKYGREDNGISWCQGLDHLIAHSLIVTIFTMFHQGEICCKLERLNITMLCLQYVVHLTLQFLHIGACSWVEHFSIMCNWHKFVIKQVVCFPTLWQIILGHQGSGKETREWFVLSKCLALSKRCYIFYCCTHWCW